MGKSAMTRSVIFGAILQILMVVLGKLIPSLGQSGNFFPIAGTAIAALSGARFSRWSPGASLGASLSGGGVAGGGSSLVGSIVAVLAGAAPGVEVQTVGIATVTGVVAGMVGGVFGRLLPKARSSTDRS
jgi:hypothetical protein